MDVDVLKRSEVDRLIRYGYSGFLLVGILLFLMPSRVRPAIEAGGAVVAPIAILAAGAAVYTLYRYVLNDFLLSPVVVHPLHGWLDRRRGQTTNPANFLAEYDVPRRLRHVAYIELRRGFFHEDLRRVFDRNHTEAAIIWLTAVECTVLGGGLLPVTGVSKLRCGLLLGAGLLATLAAILRDISLFEQECRHLRAEQDRLPTFLKERRLVVERDVPSNGRT